MLKNGKNAKKCKDKSWFGFSEATTVFGYKKKNY